MMALDEDKIFFDSYIQTWQTCW